MADVKDILVPDIGDFEGVEVMGLPRYTITRGHVAVTEDDVKPEEGHGEFVPREAYPAVNRALSQWKELTSPRPVISLSSSLRDPATRPAIGRTGSSSARCATASKSTGSACPRSGVVGFGHGSSLLRATSLALRCAV